MKQLPLPLFVIMAIAASCDRQPAPPVPTPPSPTVTAPNPAPSPASDDPPPPAGESAPLYATDFESDEIGKTPDNVLVLDGTFTVEQQGDNKLLAMPGQPLGTHGVLLDPKTAEAVEITARIRAERSGRRYPTFGVGLNGLGGYHLHVSGARRNLEIVHQDKPVKDVAFPWESGKWTTLKLRIDKAGEGKWLVRGKAWQEGADEPVDWMIEYETTDAPPPGRASLWGLPFSDQPIWYDEVKAMGSE